MEICVKMGVEVCRRRDVGDCKSGLLESFESFDVLVFLKSIGTIFIIFSRGA